MFERFTAPARDVVKDARTHARRLGHRWVGTEHLLLALLDTAGPAAATLRSNGVTRATVEAHLEPRPGISGSPAGEDEERAALAGLGIDLDRVVQSVESAFGPGALRRATPEAHRRRPRARRRRRRTEATLGPCDPGGRLRFTPRAKHALELALRETLRLRDREITVEHVALGILAEGEGLACRLIVGCGADLDDLRRSLEAATRRSS